MDGIDTARGIRLLDRSDAPADSRAHPGEPDARALVGRLAGELGLTQPTVSHHVKALLDEGVLDRAPEGRQVWSAIAPAAADRVNELLQTDAATHASDEVLDRVASDLAARFRASSLPRPSSATAREPRPARRAFEDDALSALAHLSIRGRATALLSKQQATPSGEPPEVLRCVQNAGRSQIAAAILRHLAGDRVRVRTAGSEPRAR